LRDEYGLKVVQVAFLPLGADLNTAVYRVVAADQTPYFLKLRRGVFDETSVALPKFLSNQGIRPIIDSLATQTGQLWASLDAFKVILYPFVEGHNGYEVDLSAHHWYNFGAALKRIHTVVLPPTLISRIQQETYSPHRYERIIQDMAVYCEQIFLTNEGGEDREQALLYLTSNFLPNTIIEIAYQSDKTLREE
jgi:spectinomycin phosphotransferase